MSPIFTATSQQDSQQRSLQRSQQPVLNLRQVTLLKDKVSSWETYPFCVPAIHSFSTLTFDRSICFFTGSNGTGKSTLLNAIATHVGFERLYATSDAPATTLAEAIHLTWNEPLSESSSPSSSQSSTGFYQPAYTSYELDVFFNRLQDPEIWPVQDGKQPNTQSSKQSMGKTYLKFVNKYCAHKGTFFLDEPEDMLTPVEQLRLAVLLHHLVSQISGLQFIIATHSSTLLAYPYAQIYSFNDGHIHPSSYRQYYKDFIYRMVEHPIVSLIFSSGLWRSLVTK
jgi:predicted ATPase